MDHFSYNFTNMLSKLSASVNLLLGLWAVAIYDSVVALGVQLAVQLGLHVPQEEDKDDATAASVHTA